MQFTFDSVEEIRAFVKDHLKGSRRGGKGDDDGAENTAPAPIMPPANPGMTGFQPAATTQGPAAGPFGTNPAPSFGGPAPEVIALVQRINTKIDGALASGQPADAVLNWFRQRCGAEAAAATLDQIKTVYLAKLSIPHLEETAKLMGA